MALVDRAFNSLRGHRDDAEQFNQSQSDSLPIHESDELNLDTDPQDPNLFQPRTELSFDRQEFAGSSTLYAKSAYVAPSASEMDVDDPEVDDNQAISWSSPSAEQEHEDLQQQARLYNEGSINAVSANYILPEQILKLYKRVYPVILGWWRKGASNHRVVEEINNKIREINRKNGNNSELNTFPTTLLITLIEILRQSLDSLDRASPTERRRQIKEVVNKASEAAQLLERQGIPWRILVPAEYKTKLLEAFDEAQRTEDESTAILCRNSLSHPLPAQLPHLTTAMTSLTKYIAARAGSNELEARVNVEACKKINQALAKVNDRHGVAADDHEVPVKLLEELMKQGIKRTETVRLLTELKSYLVETGYPSTDVLSRAIGLLPEMSSAGGTMFALNEYRAGSRGLPEAEAGVSGPSQAFTATSSVSSNKPLTNDYNDASFEIPSCDGGITYLGIIEGIRKAGFGYRVIVNAGTRTKPHFKIYGGSDFGKGIVGDLYQRGQFILQGLTLPTKRIQWTDIRKVCNIVEVESDSDRAPSYFLVEFRNDQREWLTKSELSAICGTKILKNTITPKCQAKYDANKRFFEKMRIDMVHPDSKKPLTKMDRRDTPWLFPEDDTTNFELDTTEGGDLTGGAQIEIEEDVYN